MSYEYNPQNSPLWKRIICTILHGRKAREYWRGPMGWVDGETCSICGAKHNVG